jgi:cation-transporting ATPase E
MPLTQPTGETGHGPPSRLDEPTAPAPPVAAVPPAAPAAPAGSDVDGLSEEEARARRARGLGNGAPPPTGRSYRQIIGENVLTFINVSLFLLGLALVLLGRPTDALVSTGVVALNVLVSVVQEVRAKRTLDHITLLTRPQATVVRDGRERAISPADLVVGDVLVVGPGDQIVVDGRVVGDGRMDVDESQLTGESDLVPKVAGALVYSGSFCVTGRARYAAERVGAQSLATQITAGARAFRRVLTPLQREVYLVIRAVLVIVAYIELLLLTRALITGTDPARSVQNATIIASLVPNGLFLSIAVAYALAAVRIARHGVLVQQSNAIESLSEVDTLCLDKTGTLTANRLHVEGVHPFGLTEAEVGRVLGVLAASGRSGNKTSAAIAAAYPAPPRRAVAEIPFSSARKWSAVAFDDPGAAGDGRDGDEDDTPPVRGVYALGAPEMLRPSLATTGAGASWDEIAAQARTLTNRGLRVLLVAHAPTTTLEDHGDATRLPEGMTPLGLVSLSDELRPEAHAALAAFSAAGVRPVIISGDDPETVAALARQAGLGADGGDLGLVSGLDLATMDEAAFAAAAAAGTVFGRITPQQKERLVRVFRARGAYVAMIGDGVNDVLSLKAANLGIAMQSGSQATRGVADLVLLDDSFAALVPAVAEGQRIVNGMRHILNLFLTRIASVGLVILSALVVGEFPLALRQGSLVTLLSVGVPSVFLVLWARPGPAPAGPVGGRLARVVLPPVVLSGALSLLVFYGALLLHLARAGAPLRHVAQAQAQLTRISPSDLTTAQTALVSFLVLSGLLLVVFAEPPTAWWTGAAAVSGDWRPTALAAELAAAFVAVSVAPPLRALFALSPLGLREIGLVVIALAVWTILVRWAWRGRLLERFLGLTGSL